MNQFSKSVNNPFKFSSQDTSVQGFGSDFQSVSTFTLCTLLAEETFLLELCADPPCVIKQASQCVDLSDSNGEHDKQVETGPEGHPPQVVL